MVKLLALTLVLSTLFTFSSSLETLPTFENWRIKHGKSYPTKEEYNYRQSIYEQNIVIIEAHNRNPSFSWRMGEGFFTDLTKDEFKMYSSGYRRPLNTKMLRAATTNVKGSTTTTTLNALPTSVDWTEKGAVTKVKNQGGCGSCWSFSATGAVEGAHFLSTGKLVSLSEQELMDCRTGGKGCDGGSPQGAFQFIIDHHGICNDTAYPYIAKDAPCKKNCQPSATIKSFKEVGHNSMDDLLTAVVGRPISVAIEADQASFQHYKSGVMDSACGTKLDHAVLVVGYGTTGGKDYYKVKNSWGDSWGDHGYILLGRGTGFPSEGQCGIQMDPSYPEA